MMIRKSDGYEYTAALNFARKYPELTIGNSRNKADPNSAINCVCSSIVITAIQYSQVSFSSYNVPNPINN